MFISPMLLQPTNEPFDNEDWLSEIKFDGIRLIPSREERIRLFTRNNNEITERFPELNFELPKGTVLDGEMIQPDQEGKPDFEALLGRFSTQNTRKIKRLSQSAPVVFCAFDILRYKSESICHWPLLDRKQLLDELIPVESQSLVKVRYIQGRGKGLFRACCDQGLEGVVLKRANSTYQPGKRPKNVWYKIVNYNYSEVYISGFKKSSLGWMLVFPDGRPAGTMELGISSKRMKEFADIIKSLPQVDAGDYVLFKDKFPRCKVKYRNLTKSGLLRLPSCLGISQD